MSEVKETRIRKAPDAGINAGESTSVNAEEYKKISEYSKEEILKLGQAIVTLRTIENKKTSSVRYTLTTDLLNKMQFVKPITRNEYLMISMLRKLDDQVPVHSFRCPIRFITGENKTFEGNWIKYELVIARDHIIGDFLNRSDLSCVSLLGEHFGYELVQSPIKEDLVKVDEDFY